MPINPARVLMVANPGGHIQQLRLLDNRLPFDAPRLWITADTVQTRSLLENEDVIFAPDVGSRAYGSLLKNLAPAERLLRKHHFVAAVSTGSGLALPYLSLAALRGVPTHYIESATRTDGPSLTGKLLRRVPRVHCHTQHERWSNTTWGYPGSVFDGFSMNSTHAKHEIRRIVVSLGTSQRYGFRRLIDRLVQIVPPGIDVLWQTGSTDVSGLDIEAHDQVPSAELDQAIKDADVLIAHAGTGIALTALLAGKSPVLVPREHRFGEHVDDHQLLTADLLNATELAVVRRVEDLDWDAVEMAADQRVERAGDSEPLRLG